MKHITTALFIALALPAAAQDQPADGLPPEIVALVDRLDPKNGVIELNGPKATLDLGTKYDFYDAADARDILVMIWGNPPRAVQNTLGLVMPA